MLQDAELYSRHHCIPTQGAKKLLDRILPEMSFVEEDVIMDVGCGSGENTRNILLDRIPKMRKLVAIDNMPKMIEFAGENMSNQNIEYHVADIEDKSSLKQWTGSISKAFSIHCFHWLKNQNKGFQSLYDILEPKGEAALVFLLTFPTWNCYPCLINDKKWNTYLKDVDQHIPNSHLLSLGAEYYRKVFEDLGFKILLCDKENITHVYKDDTELKGALTSLTALTPHIPEELRDEFMDDLFAHLLKSIPRSTEGSPTLPFTILTAHLRKL